MNEPSYDQVAAFAALTKKDVDLRRLLGVWPASWPSRSRPAS